MFKLVFFGLLIGVAAVIPGFSGGAMAAALGLYEPGVKAITGLPQRPRASLTFLAPLGVGAVLGVILFSKVLGWLLERAPEAVIFLFLGLVIGSLPALVRDANGKAGFSFKYLWATAIALGVVLWLDGLAQTRASGLVTWGWQLAHTPLYGIILAFGTIVPGISSSFILIYLGAYEGLLQAIASLNLTVIFGVGVGFILGAIPLVKLVEFCFHKFPAFSYYAVLGLLLGLLIVVFPGWRSGWLLGLDLFLLLVGITTSLQLLKMRN